MPRWVLLKHTLPDGASHFDWLLEDPSDPAGPLISFRLDATLPWPPIGPFDALRIQPHRRAYLDYQGPVSGNRGLVTRLATGESPILASPHSLRIGLPSGLIVGSEVELGRPNWRFDLESTADSGIMGEAVRS